MQSSCRESSYVTYNVQVVEGGRQRMCVEPCMRKTVKAHRWRRDAPDTTQLGVPELLVWPC